MPWPLPIQRTVYTQYIHIFTTSSNRHPTHADCPHSERNSALPCVSFTLSCVSVCFRNIHRTRPCDLRRHAACAARSPVNHWPARRRDDVAVAVVLTPSSPTETWFSRLLPSSQCLWRLAFSLPPFLFHSLRTVSTKGNRTVLKNVNRNYC